MRRPRRIATFEQPLDEAVAACAGMPRTRPYPVKARTMPVDPLRSPDGGGGWFADHLDGHRRLVSVRAAEERFVQCSAAWGAVPRLGRALAAVREWRIACRQSGAVTIGRGRPSIGRLSGSCVGPPEPTKAPGRLSLLAQRPSARAVLRYLDRAPAKSPTSLRFSGVALRTRISMR